MKLQYRETKWFAGEASYSPGRLARVYIQLPYHKKLKIQKEIGFEYIPSDTEHERDKKFFLFVKEHKKDFQLAELLELWPDTSHFKEIAPQDQEKVKWECFRQSHEAWEERAWRNWQPEIGKLYDSGDLEFELKEFQLSFMEETAYPSYQQFWVLKAKEEIVTCLGCGKEYNPLNKEECNYHNLGECQPSEEAKELKIRFDAIELYEKEIKQLQSRIKELEIENGSFKLLQGRILELEEREDKFRNFIRTFHLTSDWEKFKESN